ncbi:MFS transporter [Candidatus Bathyarchaeota archaeon]|nr:MFS transporter [Candidatus Bathyarchaeota archaeon]
MIDLSTYIPQRISTPARRFLSATALSGLGNGVFSVILQLYLISLGFSGSQLGSIFMWSSIGQLFLTIPAGVLADRYGVKPVILFGFIVTGISMGIMLTGRTLFMFSVAWLLLGVGNSTGSVFGPLFSSLFDPDDLDRAFGLQGGINIASTAIGSLFGLIPPLLVSRAGFTLTRSYWSMLLIGVVFFVVQLPMYYSVLTLADIKKPEEKKSRILRSRGVVVKFSILYTIQNLAYGAFIGLFPFYVNKKYGVESGALGVLFFAVQLIRAVVNFGSPKIADRYGSVRTITASIAGTVPFWLLFTWAPSFAWVSLFYIARMAVASISNPLMPSLFYRILYEDEKATANSITQTSSMVSNIIAPRLGGHMMENIHLESTAVMGAGLYALYSASVYLLLRNEKPKNGTEVPLD